MVVVTRHKGDVFALQHGCHKNTRYAWTRLTVHQCAAAHHLETPALQCHLHHYYWHGNVWQACGNWKWVMRPFSPWAHIHPRTDSWLFLPTAHAWELGEGYNVAQSLPGQGGVLTGGRGAAGQEPHLYGRPQ